MDTMFRKGQEEKLNSTKNWAQTRRKKAISITKHQMKVLNFYHLLNLLKIGHHSEKRHRALIERNYKRMAKSVENSDKADQHEQKAKAWEKRSEVIDLSMPSLQYFSMEL